jgi:hypothetical protein
MVFRSRPVKRAISLIDLAPDPGLVDVYELPSADHRGSSCKRRWLCWRNHPTPGQVGNFKPALSGEFHTGADSHEHR